MCVNFSPSIYGNSRLETNSGLALRLSSACDSRMMGQKYCPSIESAALIPPSSVSSGYNELLRGPFLWVLPMYLCPSFWKEHWGGGDTHSSRLDAACIAFHLQQPSLPVRTAGSGPISAGFVIIPGEANLTLPTLLGRFVEVLNRLIIVAGYSLPWLLFCSSVLLLSLYWGGLLRTEARCNLSFPAVENPDVSKLGFLFDSEPA